MASLDLTVNGEACASARGQILLPKLDAVAGIQGALTLVLIYDYAITQAQHFYF